PGRLPLSVAAGCRSARAWHCSGRSCRSRPDTGAGTAAARQAARSPPTATAAGSLRNLHAPRRRLVDQLRGILTQGVGERADVSRRGAAFAYKTLDLGQSVVRKGADVLAILAQQLVQLARRIREVVGDGAQALRSGAHVRPHRIEDVVRAARRGAELG